MLLKLFTAMQNSMILMKTDRSIISIIPKFLMHSKKADTTDISPLNLKVTVV